ncbi:MAG: RrF2 family transcriptional regulator [Anaerolineae bacterium]
MKLSAKEKAGLRAMTEFARCYGQGPIALRQVAQAQGLPLPYLEQIAADLRRSGLLESVRGAHGGYSLVRHPATVSVGDVLRAVEGALLPLECTSGREGYVCEREAVCATRTVWQSVAERLRETLDAMPLDELMS